MLEKKSRSHYAGSRSFTFDRSRSHLGDSPVFGSWRQDIDANVATGISGMLQDERSRDEGESSGSESETESEVPLTSLLDGLIGAQQDEMTANKGC
ncbi:hypothetical protein AK812_SmicGene41619 [Symbiodinium microadriaticum]|uniref:Uncharacterized protein n=1 Tax=Symbiodinium microadriaticum TaxID=2951 RepID=A0A1Q9C5N9_SYMMI|nr:hypothetical protein AK812_SmicGene41619 [Symbiodinium microadriaticum]